MKKNKRPSQAEIVKQLSDRELIINVYASQLLFLLIAAILGFFLFDSLSEFLSLWYFDVNEIIVFAVLPALLIVTINVILVKVLPKKSYDDGGVNERLFKALSIPHIFAITLLIAFAEEVLFRGVIHTFAGFIIASLLFALIHFRYLNKVVLLVSVLLLSFLIGYMYEVTNNLMVPFVAHFLIDLLLGIYYRLFMR
ncbi:CPBP family intramembrane glutamic endopeptidase [Alkalibacillus haloalkaliphilus]|uniref:CPBP family intramembrane glutamic endopeptidase n=1 Tax=Alkalibacillus haloalkaliphilus TaxID=94136 RepID=UPI00293592A6|nr:CPBP family intramembrane glutamic endopeptidase [Alkalibacillus haloalkaliphilus]MDV2580851.1 CPBP family intramembrane glutamic endopeptidase [Alkalibacillus haloalkaliphilus]